MCKNGIVLGTLVHTGRLEGLLDLQTMVKEMMQGESAGDMQSRLLYSILITQSFLYVHTFKNIGTNYHYLKVRSWGDG